MAWKQTERAIAKLVGGRRTGPTGEAAPDVVNGWLSVEVKHRRALPLWLLRAMAQAMANARPGTLPIAILHLQGQKHRDDLVICRLGDFMDWFGGGAETANIDDTFDV